MLFSRFQRLHNSEDIKNAIRCDRLLILITADKPAVKPTLLNKLATLYLCRFEQSGSMADINAAIDCWCQAVQLTPDSVSGKHDYLRQLGFSYKRRFERLGQVGDLEMALNYQRQAVLLTPDGHENEPAQLSALGGLYLSHFDRLGEFAMLDKAIDCLDQAVRLTPEGHSNKPNQLNNLGNSYLRRCEQLGELSDLDKAIEFHTQALALCHDNDPNKPTLLNNLGTSHQIRFGFLAEPTDIDKAIDHLTQAVQLTPDGHVDKPARLCNLGNSYLRLFKRVGKRSDIDNAIDWLSRSVLLTPLNHADRPALLTNLGASYDARSTSFGDLEDMNMAIEYQRQAVLLTPDGHAAKPTTLNNLGLSYRSRFDRLGDLTDLSKGIECHIQAITLTPEGHANKPTLQSNLGRSYLSHFERLGELTILDKAINCQIQAVLLAPDSSDKLAWLHELGIAYRRRFNHLDEISDANKAIDCHSRVVLLTPNNHSAKPYRLNHLGLAYLSRFERLGNLEDVDKAINYLDQSLLLTPYDSGDRPSWINNLGNSYISRFKRLGELADLDKAVDYQTQAVMLSSDEDTSKPSRLNNLGVAYMLRFERCGNQIDIDKTIDYQSQAVLLTPEGHAHLPVWLLHLGMSHLHRFASLGALLDVKLASELFQRASQCSTGSPRTRFQAARPWAVSLSLLGNTPQPAYQKIMELIPRLIGLERTIVQRYSLLSEIGDVAMEAAARAISSGACHLALEWLEQGRSIVWNQILQLRTPFEDLHTADPVLAQRLKAVGQELEHAGARPAETAETAEKAETAEIASLPNNSPGLEQIAQRHRQLAAEWDQLLEHARRIPGFDNFMQPAKANELLCAAKDGPVIVINVHSSRCDALVILPTSSVTHVPLENLTLEKAMDARVQLRSLIGCRGSRAGGFQRSRLAPEPEEQFKTMLANMWLDIVQPIFSFLGYTRKQPENELPHVTWCTTGVLSFLPLHAAGPHDGLQPNVFDLVVSSYTPTLSALLSPKPPIVSACSGILAVGQKHTKGFADLPCTVQELATIKEHAKVTRYLQMDGRNATVDAVLNAMEQYSWVHLACHATQNRLDPAQSAFHLSDGDLSLSAIARRSYKDKGLAFLSACQTATGDEKLPDEAVHLAAGLLMAGYPSVIAAMWGINDADGPEVAHHVYAHLLEDGTLSPSGASRALHKAVVELRRSIGEMRFERWVPFIHIGV